MEDGRHGIGHGAGSGRQPWERPGTELWRSDGTEAGTQLVADIFPGPQGSYPQSLANAHGTLYFSADDGFHGGELWKTDGTPGGTVLVQEINPGPASSSIGGLFFSGTRLFMSAQDGATGFELWTSTPVLSNRSPVAAAGPDQTVEAITPVRLDGSASSDPDGDILAYSWTNQNGQVVGSTAVVDLGTLPIGSHDFTLTVSDGLVSASDSVRVTVLAPPSLSIADLAMSEGKHGLLPMRFPVTLSRAVGYPVSVFFLTAPGTASPSSDYVPRLAILRLEPGALAASIDVAIQGDSRCEPDETFSVVLFSPTGATLARPVARGTILDDDCHH